MKIYIAGKISGDDGYREKFRAAQKQMEGLGYIVLNPANNPEGMSKADYMRICFAMIDCADVVCFLSDWTDSPGARLEYRYCRYIGKQIMVDSAKEVEIVEIKSILAETLRGEIGKLADYLIKGGVTVQKWIPVTERLPEEREKEWDGEKYMESDFVQIAALDHHGKPFVSVDQTCDGKWVDNHLSGVEITHWRPLPEPPKEVFGSERSTV